ncbi:hypothetical protein HELRODRAFT_164500 [Helobdella robusta]|uniref:Uncharacterized protein n=1 Tax=Helobdella robusta TaxID=6412 RepID=T1EVI5_HELRO|nr:hypothetical protein HELRODRAFT_164500 [Helobdella robusta]ESN94631.1 hypothetical protein HELRODRAFT_164500 [Helobdella robusta]
MSSHKSFKIPESIKGRSYKTEVTSKNNYNIHLKNRPMENSRKRPLQISENQSKNAKIAKNIVGKTKKQKSPIKTNHDNAAPVKQNKDEKVEQKRSVDRGQGRRGHQVSKQEINEQLEDYFYIFN